MSQIGKSDFTSAQMVRHLERENAGLRAALNQKAQVHDLITRVAAGCATNPTLDPEQVAQRAIAVAGAIMMEMEKGQTEASQPSEQAT